MKATTTGGTTIGRARPAATGLRPRPAPATGPDQATIPPPPRDRDELVASLTGVHKRFGPVPALTDLDLEVARSRITVLLGPNGAGKTTAMRLITGAMAADGGTISVFGTDPSGPDGEHVRRRCGVVSAKPSLYDRLSGRDNLRYAAELYGLGRGAAVDGRVVDAAAQFGIGDALDQRVGGYSTGMKTRLALARAVLHHPDLLLLDEPTSGLDPESAQAVLAMVRDMTSRGRSVLLCTHLLLEAEGLADEVVVVQDGTSLVSGGPDELSRRYWPRPEVAFVAQQVDDLDRLAGYPEVVDVERVDGGARAVLTDDDAVGAVVRRLSADGVMLRSVVPWRPSLEDIYFAVRREHELDLLSRGHGHSSGHGHGSGHGPESGSR